MLPKGHRICFEGNSCRDAETNLLLVSGECSNTNLHEELVFIRSAITKHMRCGGNEANGFESRSGIVMLHHIPWMSCDSSSNKLSNLRPIIW